MAKRLKNSSERPLKGWNTTEEFNLKEKWGFSGTVPGIKDNRANTMLEHTRKMLSSMCGCRTEGEYLKYLSNLKNSIYSFKEIKARYCERGQGESGKGYTSDYHCKKCGAFNDPFSYEDFRAFLDKNICPECQGRRYRKRQVISISTEKAIEYYAGQCSE